MKKQLSLRLQLSLFAALLSVFSLIALVGCDDPNSPEQPPYKLIGQYQTPTTALYVDVKGDIAAVAASSYGALVLDIHDLANVQVLFRDSISAMSVCTAVGLDTIHKYLATNTDNSDENDPFRVRSYVTGARITGINSNGPVEELVFDAAQDSITFWVVDNNDGLVATRLCRAPGTQTWGEECNFPFPPGWSPGGVRSKKMDAFGMNPNGIIAFALGDQGVHLMSVDKVHYPSELYNTYTPGNATDCAWYGNYIIVADELMLTILNADSINNPRVVSTLMIPNGDRLVRVVMDGNFACVMDTYDGVYIIDVSNPLSPSLVQLLSLPQPSSIYFDNGRLYATDKILGLVVYSRY